MHKKAYINMLFIQCINSKKEESMNFNQTLIIIGMLGIIFFILVGKNKIQMVINICLRGVINAVMIYYVNYFLFTLGIAMGISINVFNLLTATILGIPGIILLYVIHFTNYL